MDGVLRYNRSKKMDNIWHAIGIEITTCIAVIGGNAWVMKLVIDNAVLKLGKTMSEDYVTKQDFMRHIEQCPAAGAAGSSSFKKD